MFFANLLIRLNVVLILFPVHILAEFVIFVEKNCKTKISSYIRCAQSFYLWYYKKNLLKKRL